MKKALWLFLSLLALTIGLADGIRLTTGIPAGDATQVTFGLPAPIHHAHILAAHRGSEGILTEVQEDTEDDREPEDAPHQSGSNGVYKTMVPSKPLGTSFGIPRTLNRRVLYGVFRL